MKRSTAAFTALASLGLLTASSAAFAQSGPAKVEKTSKGEVYANASGMTLYYRDSDPKGVSGCNGQCATNWPPFMAPASAKASGDWTVITRSDGQKQWAYKGKPLYVWSKDKKPGDVSGDGVAKVWHAAKASA